MDKYTLSPLARLLDRLLVVVSLLAVISLVTEYGFDLTPTSLAYIHLTDIIIIWYFILYSVLKLFLSQNRWEYFKSHWFDFVLVVVVFSETAVFVRLTGLDLLGKFISGVEVVQITKIYIVAFQISIILSLVSHAVKFNQKIATLRFHPAQILMGSFFVIIIIGAFLLYLPKAVQPGKTLSFLDALFTSTSATCVTGLIVVDTGRQFSLLGQIIILFLIQVGGLGIMTYASFFALILRRNISLREKSMMREMLNYENMGLISQLLASTVIFTLTMEALGAVFLYWGLGGQGLHFGERIYSAIFHSISAFCNAGFSIYSDSFVQFQGNYIVLLTIATLIIMGGLGFPVLLNLLGMRLSSLGTRGKWLSVQSRMVLGISAVLLIAGTLFYLAAENGSTLAGLSWPQKILNSFFQSVTTRTAGFNSTNIGLITTPTVLFFLLLMFIGASPGSTGGGIKTTTFGILFAGVWSVIRGRNRIEFFRKNIPYMVLNRSLVIVLFSAAFIFIAVMILSFAENMPFLDVVFEVFSAFGTVGLSRGITPFLSSIGKTVIILTMFFGRLGALTISLAITTPKEIYHYDYPSENVMVG
ncbi:MAG: TrkH family potassium uptake protein [Calditrichia bacterium]